jgi:hypothetical protein
MKDILDRNILGCIRPGTPVAKHGGQTRPRIFAMVAGGVIVLLGLLWWFNPSQVDLPLCRFHAMTGLDCPGCGATRATHELLHGRLAAAWRFNALWALLWPVAIYATISEAIALNGGRPLPGDLPRRRWFWLAIITAAVVFFIARNWL